MIANTTTNGTTGDYRFDDLTPGTYLVEFVTPNGETFTAQDAVGDTIDSDADATNGLTGTITVTSGQETMDIDAGLLPIDLSLVKAVDDDTPSPGSNVTFTLALSNVAGRSGASGVSVEDGLRV